MSNYRVRQVLALGPMPERQLRFLVALATWMRDDTRSVSVGFDALIEDTGNARNTVRAARRELEAARKLASVIGRGRGNLTIWTVLCLPLMAGKAESVDNSQKGVSEVNPVSDTDLLTDAKGVNRSTQKGSTAPAKRGQPESADQRGPDRGLDRMAKSPGSSLSRHERANDEDERETDVDDDEDEEPDPDAALLAAAVPGADWEDVEWAVTNLQQDQFNGHIRSVRAYLRKLIDNGDAKALVDAAAAERRRAKAELARFDHPFGTPVSPGTPPGRVVPGEVIPPDTEPPGDLAVLREADPGATAGEAAAVMRILRLRPNVRNPGAVLRAEVRDGNGFKLLGEARQLLAREQEAAAWEPERAAAVTSDDAEDAADPVVLGAGLATFHARAAEIRNGTRQAAADDDSGRGGDAAPWLKVACPYCSADAGKSCQNAGTGRARPPHEARTAIGDRAEPEAVTQ